jgi:hypothetical protein
MRAASPTRVARVRVRSRRWARIRPCRSRATVARSLLKLMAYKDEYEVARLYTDGEFLQKLRQQFEGDHAGVLHGPAAAQPREAWQAAAQGAPGRLDDAGHEAAGARPPLRGTVWTCSATRRSGAPSARSSV